MGSTSHFTSFPFFSFNTFFFNHFMNQSYAAIENRIEKTINAIFIDVYTSISSASRDYDVSVRRFQRKWNENQLKSIRSTINRAFIEKQKKTIKRYIEQLNQTNMCVKHSMIVKIVNYLIRFKNRVVDNHWLTRFLKRNFQFNVRKQKSFATNKKKSHSVKNMTAYFIKLEAVMKEKEITELNVWNINETSFRINCDKAQLIVIMNVNKSLRMIDSDNRDYITSMKCVSSADDVISSFFILSEVNILHKWCQHNDLNEDTLIEISDTDYSNDNLTMN